MREDIGLELLENKNAGRSHASHYMKQLMFDSQ